MPKMPRRRMGAKKPGAKKGIATGMRMRLPKYEMPADRRLFKLDVEIGKCLLGLADALPEGGNKEVLWN